MMSFLGMIDGATKKVKQLDPSAKLYEASAESTPPIKDVQYLTQWRIVFRAGKSGNSTIYVDAATDGFIDEPVLVHSPWLQDVVISWPISMNLIQAQDVLRQAGYDGLIKTVVLRWPLYPGCHQPLYIFGDGTTFVSVGTFDKSVYAMSLSPTRNDIVDATKRWKKGNEREPGQTEGWWTCMACKAVLYSTAAIPIAAAIAGFPEDLPAIEVVAEICGVSTDDVIAILEECGESFTDVIEGLCRSMKACD